MSEYEKASQALRIAILAVDEELAQHRQGAGTVSTPAQLAAIREELENWAREITSGAVTPRSARNSGLGRMITDSWPLSSKLGQVVLAAEESYVSL